MKTPLKTRNHRKLSSFPNLCFRKSLGDDKRRGRGSGIIAKAPLANRPVRRLVLRSICVVGSLGEGGMSFKKIFLILLFGVFVLWGGENTLAIPRCETDSDCDADRKAHPTLKIICAESHEKGKKYCFETPGHLGQFCGGSENIPCKSGLICTQLGKAPWTACFAPKMTGEFNYCDESKGVGCGKDKKTGKDLVCARNSNKEYSLCYPKKNEKYFWCDQKQNVGCEDGLICTDFESKEKTRHCVQEKGNEYSLCDLSKGIGCGNGLACYPDKGKNKCLSKASIEIEKNNAEREKKEGTIEDNQKCTAPSECKSGVCHLTLKVCVPKEGFETGKECSMDMDCASKYCDLLNTKTCMEKKGAGEECKIKEDCQSGKCELDEKALKMVCIGGGAIAEETGAEKETKPKPQGSCTSENGATGVCYANTCPTGQALADEDATNGGDDGCKVGQGSTPNISSPAGFFDKLFGGGGGSFGGNCSGSVFCGPGIKGGDSLVKQKLDNSVYKGPDLKRLMIAWTRFLYPIAALAGVIAIIWAGFLYITAFGDDGNIEKAKKIIAWVAIGIVLVLGAFAIVNTIISAAFHA